MLWAAMLASVAAHGGEADPVLLHWIKERLDQLLGLGPWAAVILLGLVVLAMPVGLVGFYLVQQRRMGR